MKAVSKTTKVFLYMYDEQTKSTTKLETSKFHATPLTHMITYVRMHQFKISYLDTLHPCMCSPARIYQKLCLKEGI